MIGATFDSRESRVLTGLPAPRDAQRRYAKISRWDLVFLLVVFLVSPASAAPFLVGTWFGNGQPDDKSQMCMAHMLPNGDFRAEFRACIKGKAIDEIQTGHWSLDKDIETITLSTVNGAPSADRCLQNPVPGRQAADLSLFGTGWVYNSRRVDDKFEMPSCETIS